MHTSDLGWGFSLCDYDIKEMNPLFFLGGGWGTQVRDFLLITQGDLVNVEDCFTILQVRRSYKTYILFDN